MNKYIALRPFFWEGKNIPVGGTVELEGIDARHMLARKAVKLKPVRKVTKKFRKKKG